MLGTVVLCGGGSGAGGGLLIALVVVVLATIVAKVGMVVLAILPLLGVGAVLAAGANALARLARRRGFVEHRRPPRPRLRMVYARGAVEVRWRSVWPTRLTADDAGLRVESLLRPPLEIDADAIAELEIVARGGTRHALMVHTRDGECVRCGRDARYAELDRTREALGRALRLEPVRSA